MVACQPFLVFRGLWFVQIDRYSRISDLKVLRTKRHTETHKDTASSQRRLTNPHHNEMEQIYKPASKQHQQPPHDPHRKFNQPSSPQTPFWCSHLRIAQVARNCTSTTFGMAKSKTFWYRTCKFRGGTALNCEILQPYSRCHTRIKHCGWGYLPAHLGFFHSIAAQTTSLTNCISRCDW